MKYWLSQDFLCPIKTATLDMINDWPLHTLAWTAFGFRDWLTELNQTWGPALAFLAAALSVGLLSIRIVVALISAWKAWRDRSLPEQPR
jgi:hypothetical protein